MCPTLSRGERWQIAEDLGYCASDSLQAKAVIWVEGPSDRISITHWLRSVAPELIEGTDYSVLFYGGGLNSHLTAATEVDLVQQLIDLRAFNRDMAIGMNSDRRSARAKLKATPKRLLAEADDDWRMIWITNGREIENYVNHLALQAALKTLHPTIYKAL